jgi:glutathione S-transferase
MKMRAVLRYRRIPHVFVSHGAQLERAFQNVKVRVMPVLEYPDGHCENDSTPLIQDLEKRHPQRSLMPQDEGDCFLALLIEDLADEWLSKAMYCYRWGYPSTTRQTADWIGLDMLQGGGREAIEDWAREFEARQLSRLELVGCTDENRPMLERIADRFLDGLEPQIPASMFLFGNRPSVADVGLFGQLSQFVMDLAIIAHARERAPYTVRWVHHVHDLSGWEGDDWRSADAPRAEAVLHLLEIAGEEYLPFLAANEAALAAGRDEVRIEAGGLPYAQAPFKYQVRCLAELRRLYAALGPREREDIDPLLAVSGCLPHLKAG